MTDCSKYEPIFGAWYLKKKIGAGSFGEVYEIERREFGRVYRSALKVMSVPFNDDEIRAMMADGTDMKSIAAYYEGVVKDIAEENAIMSELKGNSHIVSYEDHQIIRHEDGVGYDILIRMELLTSLIDHLLHNPMTESDVIKLGKDLCQALIVCEQKKIIHRDIKPGNIFLSDTGDYKLGDFGIARSIEKSTGELSRKGTFTYMAPEVYKGEKYGVGADIYSLGMVMYYLLNCRRMPFLPLPPDPVTYNQKMDALRQRMEGGRFPAPHEASPALSEIVMKACSYDPEDRFSSAEEFLEALEAVGEGGSRPLRHGSGKTAPQPPRRRPGPAGEEKTELLKEIPDPTGGRTMGTGSSAQMRSSWQEASQRKPAAAGTVGGGYYDPEGRTVLDTGQFSSGSFGSYAQTGRQRPRVQPVHSQQSRRTAKTKKLLLIVAAAVVVFAGGFFGMSMVNNGGFLFGDGSKVTLTTDDIEVMTNDINFSQIDTSKLQKLSLGHDGVDMLIRVRNNGEEPLRAFTYRLKGKSSEEYLVNRDSDPEEYENTETFRAIGYVEPGEIGFMYTKLFLDDDTDKKATVEPIEITADGTLGDYSCPTGEMIKFDDTWDTYPVEVTNENEEPIHEGATVLLLRKKLEKSRSLGANWGAGKISKTIDKDSTERLDNEIYNPDIDDPKTPNKFKVIVYDPYYLADPDFHGDSEE